MNPIENPIESAIENVEKLYQSVTGNQVPPSGREPYAPIPAEKNPAQHVEQQAERLGRLLKEQVVERRARGKQVSDVAGAAVLPTCSSWETESELIWVVEIPGVSREDVHAEIRDNSVVVVGQRRPPEGARLVGANRPLGSYSCQLPIPPSARTDGARARLREGLLEIRFAKGTPSDAGSRLIVVG